MLRWPALVLGTGWLLGMGAWAPPAAAQADGAPAPPPAEPPPAAPAEPAPPPSTPPAAPPPEAAPPPAPAPAPLPPPAPPAGAFPLPPAEAGPTPQPRTAPPPVLSRDEPAAPAPVAEQKPRPSRATEGLFEEKGPPEVRHHVDEDADPDKTDHFKIGPVVGAGVPALLSVGGTMKLTRFLGAGVNFGIIPEVQLSYYGDATLSYKHLDFYGRVYPFGGGVFLHGGVGYATVQGSLKRSTPLKEVSPSLTGTADYESSGSVRTLMLTALLGYFHTFDVGFSIGIDAGAQIPIAPSKIEDSSDFSINAELPAQVRNQVEDDVRRTYLPRADAEVRNTLEKIGRTTIPTLNFRIGWIL